MFVSVFGFLLLACCFYNLVLFLQELQKKEAACGPAGARSSSVTEASAPKAPSPAAEAPKPPEPTPAPADPEV